MKYYKITNKEECHHGLQYKDGLNVDPVPFDPSGSCEPGGIYFSREDILAFLGYGPWIREVTLPEDAQVYEDPSSKKWKADRVVLGPRREITSEVIKELIEEGANVNAEDDCALIWASCYGHIEVVKLLLKHGANIHAQDDYALRYASKYGHLEIVKLLLEKGANIHAHDDEALRWAFAYGHLEVANLLEDWMEKHPKPQFSRALK